MACSIPERAKTTPGTYSTTEFRVPLRVTSSCDRGTAPLNRIDFVFFNRTELKSVWLGQPKRVNLSYHRSPITQSLPAVVPQLPGEKGKGSPQRNKWKQHTERELLHEINMKRGDIRIDQENTRKGNPPIFVVLDSQRDRGGETDKMQNKQKQDTTKHQARSHKYCVYQHKTTSNLKQPQQFAARVVA